MYIFNLIKYSLDIQNEKDYGNSHKFVFIGNINKQIVQVGFVSRYFCGKGQMIKYYTFKFELFRMSFQLNNRYNIIYGRCRTSLKYNN